MIALHASQGLEASQKNLRSPLLSTRSVDKFVENRLVSSDEGGFSATRNELPNNWAFALKPLKNIIMTLDDWFPFVNLR